MPAPIRLVGIAGDDQRTVRFYAAFPAPAGGAVPVCNTARLFAGDPRTGQEPAKIAELEALCAPTEATWVAQRSQELASYTYAAPGPQAATLRWGEAIVSTTVTLGEATETPAPPLPVVTLFEAKPSQPQEAVLRLQLAGLAPDQQVLVDAGAGHLFRLATKDGADQPAEWTVVYSKPGSYTVTVDLLDAEGYWLATLAQQPLEIAGPAEEVAAAPEPEPAAPGVLAEAPLEVAIGAESTPPWLPFRYARPLWGGARTYTAPGGTRVSRSLVQGTYLAIGNERLSGGVLWYQSTFGDWIPASSVAVVQPSTLRGVALAGQTPPPPPPPPGEPRHGVVTASLLNVRARPGVSPDNPPIAQLPQNTQVLIYEEATVDGTPWYRIGDNRWVHGAWVRIVEEPPPGQVRHGIVTAAQLNVRARPGVSAGNPVIDQLPQGAEVTIYEEQSVAGATWYRIGTNRWVHGAWVRLVEMAEALATLGPAVDNVRLPVGWVVSSSLNVRARPGISAGNPVIDEVFHNQRLDILETATVAGARWYRIGQDRWVLGQWVAAAVAKPRPAPIRTNERWVGVNLGQQTAVAYEGDTAVYAAMVATGLPHTPTVQGVFRTWQRLRSGKMSGGSAATGGYYYLEEVTWTCYFYSGYALHTAYWHDAFGRPRSHGCVNLSPYDAWWIFEWSAAGGANSPAVYVYA